MDLVSSLRIESTRTETHAQPLPKKSGRIARAYACTIFLITDLISVFICFAAATAFFRHDTFDSYFQILRYYLQFAPLFTVGFGVYGLYPGFCLAPAEELRRFTETSLLINAIGMAISTSIYRSFDAYDLVFLYAWLLGIFVFTGVRVLTRAFASRSKLWGVPSVVFGAGKEAKDVVNRLLRCRWIGYKPEIMLGDNGKNDNNYRGIPIYRDVKQGLVVAKSQGYSTALVASPAIDPKRHRNGIESHVKSFTTFIFFADLVGVSGIWTSVRDFEGILGLSTTQKLLIPVNRTIKRVIDMFGVIVGGAVILPFFFLLMLLVKLDSPGPIFFGHRRLGKGGKEFRAWKFRSMVADADKRLAECLDRDPNLKNEWKNHHKLKNDPRVTRFGRFLRKTSLDELPQLYNVFRGEMSLVGPRPIVEQEIYHYGNSWEEVSNIVPGMSGLWQVSGRSETGYHVRVEQDLYYIQNWSIWLDLFILFKTIWIVVTGKGAY